MKYLDAKKRLAFMLATVKYIRLYLNANPTTITDDQLTALTRESLRLQCKTETIETEEVVSLVGGIKSFLLSGVNETPVVTEEFAAIALKAFSSILSHTEASTQETLSLAFPELQGVYLSDLAETVDRIKLNPTLVNVIKSAANNTLTANGLTAIQTDSSNKIFGIGSSETTGRVIVDLYQLPTQMLCVIENIFTSDLASISNNKSVTVAPNDTATSAGSLAMTFYKVAGIKTNDTAATFDAVQLASQIVAGLQTDDYASTDNVLNITIHDTNKLLIDEQINPNNNLVINDSSVETLQVNSDVAMFNTAILELQGFLTQDLTIIENTYIYDKIILQPKITEGIKSIAKLYVFDDYILSIDLGRYIYSDGQLSTSEYMALDTALLGIIEHIDELELGDIQDKELDELIYIKK